MRNQSGADLDQEVKEQLRLLELLQRKNSVLKRKIQALDTKAASLIGAYNRAVINLKSVLPFCKDLEKNYNYILREYDAFRPVVLKKLKRLKKRPMPDLKHTSYFKQIPLFKKKLKWTEAWPGVDYGANP